MVNRALSRVLAGGIIPVIRAPSSELAVRAVEAVCAGGVDVVELTMTVPGAVVLIEALRKRFGDDVLVGAGTVLDAVDRRRPASTCRRRNVRGQPHLLDPSPRWRSAKRTAYSRHARRASLPYRDR